ncbi:MAG: hypothetical protein GY730_04330 [bacterium]|nr:hypothetical protein [bacterium]
MIKKIIIFILFPLVLTIAGEFVLKSTINSLGSALEINSSGYTSRVCKASTEKWGILTKWACIFSDIKVFVLNYKIILALFCIITGGLLWLVAMSRFELSFLYPFLSINYLAIIVGSDIWLKEAVSIYRYFSIVLIVLGLIFISRSPYSESK